MEKKERIFYLDFIRAISMVIIVTYHFFVHFVENNIVGTKIFSNSKWGLIGVTLFFMISGASLICNYGEKIDIKKYYKKRFLGIYPMFWIAYVCVFCYIFYQCKYMIGQDIPLYRIMLSVIGLDGYLSVYIPTFYILGEWFLGCIILIYLVFPLLRWIFNKFPIILFIVSTAINFSILLFYKSWIMPINYNFFVCLYSFIIGMYIFKYVKNIKWWHMLIGLVLAGSLYCIPINNVNYTVLVSNVIGYALFFVLAFFGGLVKKQKIQEVFTLIGKYSYAVFLVHHYIIMKVEATFQCRELRSVETLILYLTVWFIIGFWAKMLYVVHRKIMNFLMNKDVRKNER